MVALAGTLLAASLLYTSVPFVLLLGIGASCYFASRPYELLLVMVFLIPFNFIITIGSLTVAFELLKVIAWIPFLILRFREGQHPFKTSRYNKCYAIVAALLLLSMFRSHDPLFTLKQVVRLGSSIGLVYLIVNLVNTRDRTLQLLRVLTWSTFVVACYGFYQWIIQDYGALFWIVNPVTETGLAHYAFWDWRNRIISTLSTELELGHYLNLCLPIGVMLWMEESRMRLKSKWLLMSVASLLALLLTFTIGAWLSLAATIAFFVLLFERKRRWQMLIAALSVLSLFAVVALGPLREFVIAKVVETFTWDVFTRLDLWWFGLKTWSSHPFLGVGLGNFEFLAAGQNPLWGESGVGPHNTYVYLLADIGILGIAVILMIILGSIRTSLKLGTDPKLGLVSLALAFALVANLFGWLTDDGVFFGAHCNYLLWLIVGLSEATVNLSQKDPTTSVGVTIPFH